PLKEFVKPADETFRVTGGKFHYQTHTVLGPVGDWEELNNRVRQVYRPVVLSGLRNVMDKCPRRPFFRRVGIVNANQDTLAPWKPECSTGEFSPTGRIAPAPQDTSGIRAAG